LIKNTNTGIKTFLFYFYLASDEMCGISYLDCSASTSLNTEVQLTKKAIPVLFSDTLTGK